MYEIITDSSDPGAIGGPDSYLNFRMGEPTSPQYYYPKQSLIKYVVMRSAAAATIKWGSAPGLDDLLIDTPMVPGQVESWAPNYYSGDNDIPIHPGGLNGVLIGTIVYKKIGL